jgi:hypothetical protein
MTENLIINISGWDLPKAFIGTVFPASGPATRWQWMAAQMESVFAY